MNKINNIYNNYKTQTENIGSYLDFLEISTNIPEECFVRDLVDDIKKYSCETDELMNEHSKEYDEYKLIKATKKSLDKLFSKIEQLKTDIERSLDFDKDCYEELMSCIGLPIGDIENYFEHEVICSQNDVDYIKANEIAESHLDQFLDFSYEIDNQIDKSQYEMIIKHRDIAIKIDIAVLINSIIGELDFIIYRVKNYNTLLLINDENNITNNYRQSFILLFSAFDAAVFDITELLLKRNFFKVVKIFSNNKSKVTFQELGDYENIEAFLNLTVLEILKPKYIRELIVNYKELLTEDYKSKVPRIIEMINRRNVHLHNNGIADEKYFEEYNLFGCSKGDILTIDKTYYYNSLTLANELINTLVEYIKTECNEI